MEKFFDEIENTEALHAAPLDANEGVSFGRTETKEVMEKAPSMEVQAMEIRDYFIEQPELQYENWKEMTPDQRIEAIAKLENHMAEIAKRPAAEIITDLKDVIARGSEPKLENLMGLDPSGSYMYLSQDQIEDDSFEAYKSTMSSTFYKARHLYQVYNVNHFAFPVEGNHELVDAWHTNLKGDIGYHPKPENMDSRAYHQFQHQPVEVDALAFTESMMNKLNFHA